MAASFALSKSKLLLPRCTLEKKKKIHFSLCCKEMAAAAADDDAHSPLFISLSVS